GARPLLRRKGPGLAALRVRRLGVGARRPDLHGPRARGDLRAARHRPQPDLRVDDGGEFRPRRALHARGVLRRVPARAHEALLALAGGRAPPGSCPGARGRAGARAASLRPCAVHSRALRLGPGGVGLLVCGIGAGRAGLAGLLAGPMRPVYPEMGITMVIESFVVVVVGGMGSRLGAVVAGIIIGEVVSLTTFFAPKLSEIMVFVVMALVLLVRPRGLFGQAGLLD